MRCELCSRITDKVERHHLIPQNKKSDVILVCHQCADQVHLMFDNKTLKNELNTLKKLKENPKIQKYIKWIKKQPVDRKFSVKKLKRRK